MDPHKEKIIVFDGACGTNLQRMRLPASAWGRHEGCNEYLNLSAPEAISELHGSFLEAGATAVETNTFGANDIVLAEYGLSERVEEINAAAVECARAAVRKHGAGAWIAGAVGPTTKLPSLGHITFDEMAKAYARQIRALTEAGVDLILIETCQDLMQIKIALVACFDTLERLGKNLPVMVSMTVESTGTMLVGTDVAAAAAAIEPFPVFSLGLNCATGPEGMKSHVRYLARHWPGRISCLPNAGMPEVVGGKTVYPLAPEDFAARMKEFVVEEGVSIVGGCCGTTPDHIRRLAESLSGAHPAERNPQWPPSLSSLYQSVEIRQEIAPLLIGERANANGSRRFRELLLADDYQGCLKAGLEQQEDGAHAVDLCAAYAGRDEKADLVALTRLFAKSIKIPLVIDSTSPDCIEAVLRTHPGRCLINSVNLEDGGKNMERICLLAKKYGAAVIALTIGEKGMAMTVEEKVAVAREIHDLAVGRYGLRPSDLLFDVLTFTVGSGDPSLAGAAEATLAAVRQVKAELPGVFTSLGVSNVSFGLSPRSRRFLNSVFLHEAVEAGLDAAIVDAAKILPFARIPEEDRRVCLDLIYNRRSDPETSPLSSFIAHFSDREAEAPKPGGREAAALPPEEFLAEKVVTGDKTGLEDLLEILLTRRPAQAIIGQLLVPAMRRVGDLFGRGEMLLPFVLQSAEVVRECVKRLEPRLAGGEKDAGKRMLLATVAGDVHDIGKNLVDILLTNNGYKVYNLGIKVPAETVIEKAREYAVDAIGLSGLLVKSAIVMQESMPQYAAAGLSVPILLGGAALTEKFVAECCVPGYTGPVVYCADAFAGLSAMRALEKGPLSSTVFRAGTGAQAATPGPKGERIFRDNPAPTPPFLGARRVAEIDVAALFPYMNEQALFRGRWGYRRGKLSAEEYDRLVTEKVRPLYEALKRRCVEEGLLCPKAAYGYFRCFSEGDTLVVEDAGKRHLFPFPRQAAPPHLCIADYFKPNKEGGDVVAFFVVTVGERIGEAAHELFSADRYHDYLMLHAFGVEAADALAEYWHERIRAELGIGGRKPSGPAGYIVQEYQGSRYGFGYPSCPDLSAHKGVFDLLDPGAIGVTLTETMEMVPEHTTSAIIAHHPQAKYFAV
ncbi:MAG: methionine synthase [Deltaproteobacteria bacterium]|nr:methionine synthase [Deltaproteobacteria bacterium]